MDVTKRNAPMSMSNKQQNCHFKTQTKMPSAACEIIDDIEDLISSQDITPKERYASKKSVNVRSKRRKEKAEPAEKIILESVVPGNLKIVYFRDNFVFCRV